MGQLILGIETSCDETAAAIIGDDGHIYANQISSQISVHQRHGGVVPEIAARAHIDQIRTVIEAALAEAQIEAHQLNAIAATAGPGLIGGVLVGTVVAKAMAAALSIPYYAVNHLEGHALTARLTNQVRFPYLLLLVSGGHTQILAVEGPAKYRLYGATLDDAAGEAFDKSAKALGLPMPGGPNIEALAKSGDATAFDLPRPMIRKPGCDLSFSGLKTAVIQAWDGAGKDAARKPDLAAALQQAVCDCLCERSRAAMQAFKNDYDVASPDFVVAGGVAANQTIRDGIKHLSAKEGFAFHAPPVNLCTDNAVMIAWVAAEYQHAGLAPSLRDFAPLPRWPLASLTPNEMPSQMEKIS
ncbi:MAG: tRNA (adenosine(37)-N6)-threonylcarbamoyltransferase complex transferase subunit TsaD [Candidatus Puniceispirillales bacterium]